MKIFEVSKTTRDALSGFLGEVGQPSGLYDFKTGEELLIGDFVKSGYVSKVGNNLSLGAISEFNTSNFLIMRAYGAGPYGSNLTYYSNEGYTDEESHNFNLTIDEMEGDFVYVLWKDPEREGNILNIPTENLPYNIELTE